MRENWAAENLQVIRTLMERSALYRRALGPIFLAVGTIGMLGGALALALQVTGPRAFVLVWVAIAAVAVLTGLLLVRRQALRDREAFWSPPARRVACAVLPGWVAGATVGAAILVHPGILPLWSAIALWLLFHGLGLHAAGFFVNQGIRFFAWTFLALGAGLAVGAPLCPWLQDAGSAHFAMAALFGVPHVGFGAYLSLTQRPAAP